MHFSLLHGAEATERLALSLTGMATRLVTREKTLVILNGALTHILNGHFNCKINDRSMYIYYVNSSKLYAQDA